MSAEELRELVQRLWARQAVLRGKRVAVLPAAYRATHLSDAEVARWRRSSDADFLRWCNQFSAQNARSRGNL